MTDALKEILHSCSWWVLIMKELANMQEVSLRLGTYIIASSGNKMPMPPKS